jgi:hypothetical protein
MTNTNMNINVNVMCHALVVAVSCRVVSLMQLNTWSLLGPYLAIASYGREGMIGEPRLYTDWGMYYWSETIKR